MNQPCVKKLNDLVLICPFKIFGIFSKTMETFPTLSVNDYILIMILIFLKTLTTYLKKYFPLHIKLGWPS